MMKLLVLATLLAAGQSQSIICERGDRYQADPYQCDQYYYCEVEGEKNPEPILCRDGLVFDPYSRQDEPCDHFFNVDCGDRGALQTPITRSAQCPRLNGYYSHPDQRVCNVFYSCEDGQSNEITCPPGLWFSELSGTCVWPADAAREDENGEVACTHAQESGDGFTCPQLDPLELERDPHPRYADEEDCAFFWVCLNGVAPRRIGCDNGDVYNEVTSLCDKVENVPECQGPLIES